MAVDQALRANFARLAKSSENEAFRAWLAKQRESWRDALETSLNPQLVSVAQGRCQQLADIQKELAAAMRSEF